MAKYISSISDFVIQAMTTGSVMENKEWRYPSLIEMF